MRPNTITILLLAAIVTGCQTPTFTLTSVTGDREYGPYEFVQGQRIDVGSGVFVLQKQLPSDRLAETRMKALFIPEINFRNADIRDVVLYLSQSSVHFSEEGKWQNPPVDLVLVLPKDRESLVPKITFQARFISMHTAIKTVAKLTHLNFSIHDGVAWLELKEE